MEYDTLDIRFQPNPRGAYAVTASSPRGEASGEFSSPFADLDLENFVLRVGRPRRGIRRLDSPEMETAKTFGDKLFNALFCDDVRDLYHSASAEADIAGKGLRVTLRLSQAPELSNIPWEYLCEEGRFLSVSERTPIVRYLDLERAHTPLAVTPPLRILGMVSSPSDVVELNVEEEKQRLNQALESLVSEGQVEIVWLEKATLTALLEALEGDDIHIFHYIGHGAFEEQKGDGVLLLEDEFGRGRSVTGMKLGQLLADERTLRLAVLNACEGARTDNNDPFAGVAASLVKNEIPSVVAMQFEITDDAAILFAGGLYESLARGSPIDAALASARKAIWADYNDIEWGTPVLFMRVPNGQIFDVHGEEAQKAKENDPSVHTLSVELEPSTTALKPGDDVAWRLTVLNSGNAPISGITALQNDGLVIETAPSLDPGRRCVATWRTSPDEDVVATVTVSGETIHGDRITEQVSARVRVDPEAKDPASAPTETSGDGTQVREDRVHDERDRALQPTTPAAPTWLKQPRVLIAGGATIAALIVAVVVALIATRSDATTEASTSRSPTTTTPGATTSQGGRVTGAVLEEDFSGDELGWRPASGAPPADANDVSGQYTDGWFRIAAEPVSQGRSVWYVPTNASAITPAAPPNVDVRVSARKLTGSDGDTAFGLACRTKEDKAYLFLLSVTGNEARIAKAFPKPPYIRSFPGWTASTSLASEDVNRLRAICTSTSEGGVRVEHLTFFVNGTKLIEAVDDTGRGFGQGSVGVVVRTGGEALEAEFDEFVVTQTTRP